VASLRACPSQPVRAMASWWLLVVVAVAPVFSLLAEAVVPATETAQRSGHAALLAGAGAGAGVGTSTGSGAGSGGAVSELQQLLSTLVFEEAREPLQEFLPRCVRHSLALAKKLDKATALPHLLQECDNVQQNPGRQSGFKSHDACQAFARKLASCRAIEIDKGTTRQYEDFCRHYHQYLTEGALPPEQGVDREHQLEDRVGKLEDHVVKLKDQNFKLDRKVQVQHAALKDEEATKAHMRASCKEELDGSSKKVTRCELKKEATESQLRSTEAKLRSAEDQLRARSGAPAQAAASLGAPLIALAIGVQHA